MSWYIGLVLVRIDWHRFRIRFGIWFGIRFDWIIFEHDVGCRIHSLLSNNS